MILLYAEGTGWPGPADRAFRAPGTRLATGVAQYRRAPKDPAKRGSGRGGGQRENRTSKPATDAVIAAIVTMTTMEYETAAGGWATRPS